MNDRNQRKYEVKIQPIPLMDQLAEVKTKIEEEKIKHPDSYSLVTSSLIKKLLRLDRRINSLSEEETTSYIKLLMKYAFYLKVESNRNNHLAKEEFEKVLSLRRNNSTAHYRLGYIYYNEKQWINSINHFDQAIRLNGQSEMFELSDDQLIKANQFISYCSLKQANDSLEEANMLQEDIGQLTDYQGIKIEELFKQIKQKLRLSEFVLVTNGVQEKVSKARCEEIIDNRPENHLYLYFSDSDIMLYGLNETTISKTYADYLKYLLEKGSPNLPIKVNQFPLEFDSAMTIQETIKPGTVKTNIFRLKKVLEQAGYTNIISSQNGYFISGVTYQIAYREDQYFDLSLVE